MTKTEFKVWDSMTKTMYSHEDFPDNFILNLNGEVLDLLQSCSFVDGNGGPTGDQFILCQYTGVDDMDGNEIYNHDIVEVEYGRGKVIFHAGCFMIEWMDDKEALMELLAFTPREFQRGRARQDLKRLGSIHEINQDETPEFVSTWAKATKTPPFKEDKVMSAYYSPSGGVPCDTNAGIPPEVMATPLPFKDFAVVIPDGKIGFTMPREEYNEMKGKMESTTLPEWQQYYKDLAAFRKAMDERKPCPEHFGWDKVNGWPSSQGAFAYGQAMNEWSMSLSCDAPNKPGYVRANND
jgi:hypothetical protein